MMIRENNESSNNECNEEQKLKSTKNTILFLSITIFISFSLLNIYLLYPFLLKRNNQHFDNNDFTKFNQIGKNNKNDETSTIVKNFRKLQEENDENFYNKNIVDIDDYKKVDNINFFTQFFKQSFIDTIQKTKNKFNVNLLPTVTTTTLQKFTQKELFSHQFIDNYLQYTQILTCVGSYNNKHTMVNGITNQLYSIANCIATIGRISGEFKNNHFNSGHHVNHHVKSNVKDNVKENLQKNVQNDGTGIKLILEPEMCFKGPPGMLTCEDHFSLNNLFNIYKINEFISNKENWKDFINIPKLENFKTSSLQWNVTTVTQLFPKKWKDTKIKVLTKIPFLENFKNYEFDLLISRKEMMKDFGGLIFISKEEYLQLYCLRDLMIDSLLKWSITKDGSMDHLKFNLEIELFKLWNYLFENHYGKSDNTLQQDVYKDVHKDDTLQEMLQKVSQILLQKKECHPHTSHFIQKTLQKNHNFEPYYFDRRLNTQELTLDAKARHWIYYYRYHTFNYLQNLLKDNSLQKENLLQNNLQNSLQSKYLEILKKKWNIMKKINNVGFLFNDWIPLQPNEWKFYLEILENLKPLNRIESKVDEIFKKLRQNNDYIVVMHVQLPKLNDHFYPGCMRVPSQFDNLISSQQVAHTSWINLFINQLRLPPKTVIILIGYGFHFRNNNNNTDNYSNSLFPKQELIEKYGITLTTQFDLLGSTTNDNQLIYSLLARRMALKSDFYIQGVCGTMFGYHILMERIVNGQLSCAADYIELKEYIYGIGMPNDFNHKTEMEFFFPRFHPGKGAPSFIVEKCETYTKKNKLMLQQQQQQNKEERTDVVVKP
ncbi:hypothetical protein ABK040_008658 [Willaertia magna]